MKKKWLIGFLAASMALTVSLGIAACGKSGKNNDEEIATSAIEQIKALYKNTPDSDSKYEVTGQVRGSDQTLYNVTWTAIATTEGIDIDDYVSIGEMDATSKSITITLTMGEQAVEFDLQASVTVGKVTKTTKFSHKLNAKPSDAKGTKDDPYSTRKVIEIASGLGTVGSYYYSDADKGKDIPTRVWVKGYIIDCGNSSYFGAAAVGWVYIAESKDSTEDSADALCLYRVEYDDTNLTCFEDLAIGKEIMVNGFIEWYQGKNDAAPYAEIASFKTASGYESVYCDYLEKEERTPQQNVELALSKVNDTMTFNTAEDHALPESTIPGVTFTWSTANTTYTISNNKLHIGALPTSNAEFTITVTATVEGATVTKNTKDVTVTIKAAVTATEGTAVLDFSGVTESGEGLSNGEVTSEIIGFASANSNLTKVETSYVYKGNGSGGAYPNVGGFLKFGKSDAAGQLKLTFSKNVSSVVINCHDWYKKNDQNPTNSNTVAVNDSATQLMPYNEEATPGDLTFNLATATNVIKIDVNKRGFVFKITVTFADGQQQPELDANQKVDAVKQALNVDLTNFKAVGNTIDLDDAAQNNYGVSVAWAITAPAQGADTYVKIEGNTMSILALPEEETQFTLTATFTLTGATTVTKTFNFTLQPAGQQGPEAGSAQKPFTVLEAVAYGKQNLATSGAQDTKEVYVTGYVIDTGSWKADGYWQYVYIADTATQSKSDTTKVIQVFKLYTDSTYLILSGDLIKGRQITVHGHLKNYTSNKTTYEFDDYTKDGTPVHPVASSASTLTRDQKLEAAKTAVGSLTNDDVIASFDLPDTVVSGVSYKWSIPQNDYAQVTTEQGKSKVTVTRPAYGTNNQTATLSLTITCDGTEEQPLTWELTIKQKPSTTEESELYILPSAHQNSGSNNSYTSNCDVTYNGVTWNIEGNAQTQPWRFGGKSLTAQDRKLTGKTAIQGKVSKVLLTLTDGGSITVNSVTLKVYSADPTSGSPVSTKTATYAKGQLITFTADEGEDWSNCYFQIIFNLTVSGSSNKYVAITNLEFRGTGIEE